MRSKALNIEKKISKKWYRMNCFIQKQKKISFITLILIKKGRKY